MSSNDHSLPCLFCDYDLRAHNTDPVICPECGNSIARSQLRGPGANRRWARYLRTDLRMIKTNLTCMLLLTGAFALFAWHAGLIAFLLSAGWAFPPSTGGLPNTGKRLSRFSDRAAALCCALAEWVRTAIRLGIFMGSLFLLQFGARAPIERLTILALLAGLVVCATAIVFALFDPTAWLARIANRLERRLLGRLIAFEMRDQMPDQNLPKT